MESLSKNNVKNSLLTEENPNLSAFRRRNKILILILLSLIISLTVIICALIAFLIQSNTSPDSTNPAVGAFCTVSNDTSSCLSTFDPIISPKSRTDPNQIFTLSLQTAARELQNTISFVSIGYNTTAIITFTNCSLSLRDGLRRIGEALGTMRVNPFVEVQSDEQRIEMMNWISDAEEDLRSCLDDLDEVAESTAVSAATEKVLRVKKYVNNSKDFLREYALVLQIFWGRIYSVDVSGMNMIVENLFILCVGGSAWLFILFLFLSLCRIR